MSTFDWLRINNKYDFRLASRFAQGEFFKFFIAKENYVRIDEFAAIPILLRSKSLIQQTILIFFEEICPKKELFWSKIEKNKRHH